MDHRLLFFFTLFVVACQGDPKPSPAPDPSANAVLPTASESASAPPAPPPDPCASIACLSIERCEAGQCVPHCPKGEVYVPATPPDGFVMGTGRQVYKFGKFGVQSQGHGPSDAAHRVVLSMPFCMDQTEVSVAAFTQCIEEAGCEKPAQSSAFRTYPKQREYPMNVVTFPMASYYCGTQGKHLPTEAQWEWAATEGDGRAYPWGNEAPTCEHADYTYGPIDRPAGDFGCRGGGPSPVGSMPKGAKKWPAGEIQDLAGNVWEWTLDTYWPYPSGKMTDPVEIKPNGYHSIRGGGWNRSFKGIDPRFRGSARIGYHVPGLGFRCVRNPKEHKVLLDKIEALYKKEAWYIKIHRGKLPK